jgi:hypothetical protein
MPDNFAYEVTGNALFGVVDLNTGVFTSLGSMGVTLAGLGTYGGVIYGGDYHGSMLYSVNTSTGALTAIGTGNISYGDFGSTTAGLYAFGDNGDLYSINPTNGAATDIGATGLSFGGIVMGMSSGSSTLYLTQNNSLYSLNTTSGSATLIGTTNESESGFGALVSVGGALYGGAYDASTPDIYSLDPQSGAATFVAASPSTPSSPGVAGFWGLAPIPQQTLTTTYDVVRDFNATGIQPAVGDPFTYGTETSLNIGFTPLPYYGNTSSSVGGNSTTTDGTVNNYYFTQPLQFSGPSVAVVATGDNLSFPSSPPLVVPNDVLAMLPGSPAFNAPDLIVTRFTAPIAGIFDIAGSFADLQRASVGLTIVIEGTTVFSSSFSGSSPYQATIPFSIAGISLDPGQTIDFVVDSLGQQYFDCVGLKALITETPVTPTVAVSIDNTDVNIAKRIGLVTFVFSEAPTAFTLADTSAVGGTLSNLQQVNATTYTATFTGAADTDTTNASVSVTAGSWLDGRATRGLLAAPCRSLLTR